MTHTLEHILERASRLSAAGQEVAAREIRQIIARIEAEEKAEQDDDEPFVSAYDLAKDILGRVDSGTPDLATNKKHMEGFGESSMR